MEFELGISFIHNFKQVTFEPKIHEINSKLDMLKNLVIFNIKA